MEDNCSTGSFQQFYNHVYTANSKHLFKPGEASVMVPCYSCDSACQHTWPNLSDSLVSPCFYTLFCYTFVEDCESFLNSNKHCSKLSGTGQDKLMLSEEEAYSRKYNYYALN